MMKQIFFGLRASAVCCALALQLPATALAGNKETVVHFFGGGADGAFPVAGLIDVKGALYGTTPGGGAHCQARVSCGTVFALDTATGAEMVLYSFCSQKKCEDGQEPVAGLVDVNGTLYGTTAAGGAYGGGTVFALDPKTGAEKVLHAFGNGKDAAILWASLIAVDGTLYGTTAAGGANCEHHNLGGCGTVFSIDPATGAESILYSFCAQKKCFDGSGPEAALIEVNGTMYGTTGGGGAYGSGTVFAFDMKTGAVTVLHSFGSNGDGALPSASLVDVKGTLYGTTTLGGASGNGTVFSLDPATGSETLLYFFCRGSMDYQCPDGDGPDAGLIDVNGTLYGTTIHGGIYQPHNSGNGVVFALDPKTGAETVLAAFRSSRKNGAYSEAGLLNVNGTLYGTTGGGGDKDNGTVFALRP